MHRHVMWTTAMTRLAFRRLSCCGKRLRAPQQRQSYSSSSSNSTSSSFLRLLEWYSRKLDTHPWTTKCLTSGMIAGLGDVLCQQMTPTTTTTTPQDGGKDDDDDNKHRRIKDGTKSWNVARTGRFAFLGTVLVGPCIHLWYGWLAATVPHVVARVALDQVVFTPVFLSAWLTSLWTLQGGDRDPAATMAQRLTDQVPGLVTANWILWVPAQLVNFRHVPVKYQVLFSNVVALVWNCYLSYVANRNKPQPPPSSSSTSKNNGAASASHNNN